MSEILDRPLDEIAHALRSGAWRSEGLLETAIARHERAGERLRAYHVFDADRAREEARTADGALSDATDPGPLAGLPISVKDLYGVEGYATFAGTARRLPAEWESEGFLVRTLREQRAVITGKTQTVELALGGLGNNPHWGTPVNPWDPTTDRVPGGSSGGAGVSLGEGSAVVALGTDTAGSIRVPASMTGTVGHKMTWGRWPTDGCVPLSPTLDVVGALTRTVRDAAYFFAAVDPDAPTPERFLSTCEETELDGIRLGICGTSRVWQNGQDDVVARVRAALSRLEERGARLVEIDLPQFDDAFDLYARGILVPAESSTFISVRLPEWADLLHETVGKRLRAAASITARDYLAILHERRALADTADARLREIDALVTPTVPITPPAIADIGNVDRYMRLNRPITLGTNPVNVLDLCAITLPCGLDDTRMPVGLQIVGRHGDDERLLAIALAAERALGTAVAVLGGAAPLGGIDADPTRA